MKLNQTMKVYFLLFFVFPFLRMALAATPTISDDLLREQAIRVTEAAVTTTLITELKAKLERESIHDATIDIDASIFKFIQNERTRLNTAYDSIVVSSSEKANEERLQALCAEFQKMSQTLRMFSAPLKKKIKLDKEYLEEIGSLRVEALRILETILLFTVKWHGSRPGSPLLDTNRNTRRLATLTQSLVNVATFGIPLALSLNLPSIHHSLPIAIAEGLVLAFGGSRLANSWITKRTVASLHNAMQSITNEATAAFLKTLEKNGELVPAFATPQDIAATLIEWVGHEQCEVALEVDNQPQAASIAQKVAAPMRGSSSGVRVDVTSPVDPQTVDGDEQDAVDRTEAQVGPRRMQRLP